MRSSLRGLALVGALFVGAAGFGVVQAAEEAYKPKVDITSLAKGPLAGVEGKEVIIRHFAIPPGHVGGKHFHPGSVFVYVLEGTLTIETEGKIKSVSAGELYEEPMRRVMQARNLSTTDGLKLVVFQVGDAGKPMMIKAD